MTYLDARSQQEEQLHVKKLPTHIQVSSVKNFCHIDACIDSVFNGPDCVAEGKGREKTNDKLPVRRYFQHPAIIECKSRP